MKPPASNKEAHATKLKSRLTIKGRFMQQKKENLLFQVVIPGKVGIKKNSRKIFKDRYGRIQNTPSEKYKNWEAVALAYVAQAKGKNRIELPIFAYFEFHFKNRKALPDTSNCIEGPQDLMQTMGIYSNDHQIVSIEAHRFVSGDEKTVVRLYQGVEQ